jgi:flagellar hook-associated protein 2
MSVVDGIVSGLDTTTVINQLMAIERAPVTRLQTKQDDADKKIQAWGDIQRATTTLRTSALALARASTFSKTSATSSSTDLATVTARDGAKAMASTFKVHQLATADSKMTATSIGASTDRTGIGLVAAGVGLQALGVTAMTVDPGSDAGVRDVTVTTSGATQVTVQVGTESITVDRSAASVSLGGVNLTIAAGGMVDGAGKVEVVNTNDASTVGSLASSFTAVRAQILGLGSTTNPDRRLVITSQATGAASKILVTSSGLNTATSTALASWSTVSDGKDARVEIGDGVFVERSTNLLSDVFDGLDVQLVKADPTKDVVIESDLDVAGSVGTVRDWVNSVNAAISLIDSKSAYDATAKTGGVLLGDSTARNVRQSLAAAMSVTSTDGTFRNLPQIGISVDAKGRYSVDETKLGDALRADPSSVAQLFARSAGSSDDAVSFVSGGDETASGTYDVVVSQPAQRASVSGDAFATLGSDETLTFQLGGKTVSVALTNGQSTASVISTINASFTAHGLSAFADLDGGAVRVQSNSYGSKAVLTVASSRVGTDATGLGGPIQDTETEHAGVDVEGTINGEAAEGVGLTLSSSAGQATGLRLQITATAPGSYGQVTYAGGVGGTMLRALGATGGVDTAITNATAGLASQKRDTDSRINDYNLRLADVEARMRRQFTQMETMISQLRSQGSRLTSLLSTGTTTSTTSSTNG